MNNDESTKVSPAVLIERAQAALRTLEHPLAQDIFHPEVADVVYEALHAFIDQQRSKQKAPLATPLPNQETTLESFVCEMVNPDTYPPQVTCFLFGAYTVQWSCLTSEGARVGNDEFDLYRDGTVIGWVSLHRGGNEEAIRQIAALIAPGKQPAEMRGKVS